MKRSVNFRRRPRRATANDILFTLQRLGMDDKEIKEVFTRKQDEQIIQPVDEAERQTAECEADMEWLGSPEWFDSIDEIPF